MTCEPALPRGIDPARLLADLTRLDTPRQKAEEMLHQVRGLGPCWKFSGTRP